MSAADDADQYRAFAASVACAAHPGEVGAIIANHIDAEDLPHLLDHLRDRLQRSDAYRAFAVNVSDLVRDDENMRGLLLFAELPDLLTHLRERLAQARAEGETAGRDAERERVLALVHGAYDAAREAERRYEVIDPSAASSALDVLEQMIERGEHITAAAGGAQ